MCHGLYCGEASTQRPTQHTSPCPCRLPPAPTVLPEAATYYLRVSGTSMTRAGIPDGNVLVVDRAVEPADGDVVRHVIHEVS
nr:S24 family peptidase [Salinibacter altiplanensis]